MDEVARLEQRAAPGTGCAKLTEVRSNLRQVTNRNRGEIDAHLGIGSLLLAGFKLQIPA